MSPVGSANVPDSQHSVNDDIPKESDHSLEQPSSPSQEQNTPDNQANDGAVNSERQCSPMEDSSTDIATANNVPSQEMSAPVTEQPSSPQCNQANGTKSPQQPSPATEEPMDTTNDEAHQANLLKEVTKTLPSEDKELDQIADCSIEDDMALEKKLQVAVARVVRSYRQTRVYKHNLKDELETKQRFRVEHSRRTHDYDEFVFEFVRCLADNNQLPSKLFKKPPVAPPTKGSKHKRKRGRPPKTTLLLNGNKIN